ncbi:hypothetical protein F5879DRAFT_795380 [Lentinula edodes]|nr:uncharacterized protein C8R40DRAFT_1163533 [Lentinula edodes]KAH7869491.1 hypothetical protein C8R40DRAFT_1163533 [Lentinula edodes]KAJ3895930.1 hypothetical protein GG344DRAFT_37723 [Lentinula edodes]KAJ3907607.1 hypothetical protein F5879DRAFT_795380 [Lentinula edodes]KAJ3921265.1 hypothetical protein F5877DRAFT_36399 [Lentinula edodes]
MSAQPIPFGKSAHGLRDSQTLSSSSSVQLPRTLARPEFIEVSPVAIAAAAPELVNVPLDYIRRRLRSEAPQMMAGLSSLAPSHVPSSLPKSHLPPSLSIPLRAPPSRATPTYPTHVLAVSSSKSSHDTQAIMVPVHSLVLAAQCARLPELRTPNTAVSHTLHLPVIPMSVPSPAAFTILRSFMYDHRLDGVLKALFPVPPSFLANLSHSAVRATMSSGPALHQLSLYLCEASGHNLQTLTTYTAHVKDLWQDMVVLGLFDSELWDTLDLAWDIVLGAMNLAVVMRQ